MAIFCIETPHCSIFENNAKHARKFHMILTEGMNHKYARINIRLHFMFFVHFWKMGFDAKHK